MPTSAIILRITDGTTTCELAGNTDYSLRDPGWSPAVATLRDDTLGSQSEYNDVEDPPIPLYAKGATAAVMQANVRKLEQLLSQAARFEKGHAVNPVRIEYQPQGSDLAAPLQARIRTGTVSRLGEEYSAGTLYAPVGVPVDVTITRTGLWYSATEEASNAPTGFRSYDKAALTFGTTLSGGYHPTRIAITGLTTTTTQWHPGYVAVAPSGNHIGIYEGETIFDSSGTVVASTTARGGNLRRFTVNTDNDAFTFGLSEIAASQTITYIVSTSIHSGSWMVLGRLYFDAGGSAIDTPWLTLPTHVGYGGERPKITVLPTIRKSGAAGIGEIYFFGSGIMFVDWVAVVGDGQISAIGNPNGYGTTTPSLQIDPQATTQMRPTIRVFNAATPNRDVRYEGNPFFVSTGNTMGVAWFQNEINTNADWAITTTGAGTTPKTHTIQAFRRKAYVIPE